MLWRTAARGSHCNSPLLLSPFRCFAVFQWICPWQSALPAEQSAPAERCIAFIRLECSCSCNCNFVCNFAVTALPWVCAACFCLIYWLGCGNLFAKRLKLQLRTHFLKIQCRKKIKCIKAALEKRPKIVRIAANIYETNCISWSQGAGIVVFEGCEKESTQAHAKWVTWKDQLSHKRAYMYMYICMYMLASEIVDHALVCICMHNPD